VDLQASREGILFHGPRHYASIKYPFEGISEENTSTINPWLSQRDADAAESRNNESRASREDADKFTGPLITFPPRPPAPTLMRPSKGPRVFRRRFLIPRLFRHRSRIRRGAFDDCLPDDRSLVSAERCKPLPSSCSESKCTLTLRL